jgi:hypothetical protein
VAETTGAFSKPFADDASVASEGLDFRRVAFRLTEAVVNGPSRIPRATAKADMRAVRSGCAIALPQRSTMSAFPDAFEVMADIRPSQQKCRK